jgi:FAD/FMN-containing dehydrogenase
MIKMNKLLEVRRGMHASYIDRLTCATKVDQEKLSVVVQAGITLTDLHTALARHGLAMRNLGSISDQTLGGIVATAGHGSGIAYQVMSADVLALTLLLADGSRVTCSRMERTELFLASLCGLGATGIILNVHLAVERAFRLKDVQCPCTFEDVVEHLDELVRSAQHVRFWWIAATHTVKCSVVNRTTEVRHLAPNSICPPFIYLSITAQTPADTVVLELAARVSRGAVLPLRGAVLPLREHAHGPLRCLALERGGHPCRRQPHDI